MTKVCILIGLLLQLLFTLVQGQESPCPRYFAYVMESGTNNLMGQITIHSPPIVNQLHLTVTLKVSDSSRLPKSDGVRLKLAQSDQESAQAVLEGRNLLYHVYFPIGQPIPTLYRIWFNNEIYCTGPEPSKSHVTTITLEHTLIMTNMLSGSYPMNLDESSIRNYITTTPKRRRPTSRNPSPRHITVTLSPNIGKNPFLHKLPNRPPSQYNNSIIYLPQTTQRIPSNYRTTTTAPAPPNNNNNECGITSLRGKPNLLIAGGRKTSRGQWPWLVALFVNMNNDYQYLCGGTVLSNRHVLTAGHCLKTSLSSNEDIHPNVLEVALGRFKLLRFREGENRGIAKYIIHPDYNHLQLSGDSDVAILILRTPVEYNSFIKPICLWSGSSNLNDVVDKSGYVVGWGKDENNHPYTEEPFMAMMPIVSMEECHWSYEPMVKLTSYRTFCAGMRNGTGPCNGDSGSGLVIYDHKADRYRLRGVVSRSTFNGESLCDLKKFVVFVDVAKYTSWIQDNIATT